MRGTQELLRKNRMRRQERTRTRANDAEVGSNDEYNPVQSHLSPQSRATEGSGGTWDSGSEVTSVVSVSSVWTDTSNPTDRSSRRALILQMAKARMKSNKDRGDKISSASIAEETMDSVVEESEGRGNSI